MTSFEMIWYVEIKLLKTVQNFLTCLLNITKNATIKFNTSKASEKHGYKSKEKKSVDLLPSNKYILHKPFIGRINSIH